jgi:hypothetical protein
VAIDMLGHDWTDKTAIGVACLSARRCRRASPRRSKLDFPVRLLRILWQDETVVQTADRGDRLLKDDRFGWQREVSLPGMVGIVETDRDELPDSHVRGQIPGESGLVRSPMYYRLTYISGM